MLTLIKSQLSHGPVWLALFAVAGGAIGYADPLSLWIGADPFNTSTGILDTTRTGTVLHTIDPLGNGGFGNGIGVDVAGNGLYVSDEGTMQKVNLTTLSNIGGAIAAPSPTSLPEDMTFDGTDLWRTDYGLDRVEKIDPATNTILSFFTPAGISGPVGVAWDGTGLWVGDFNGSRVEKYTAAGVDTGIGFNLGVGTTFVGVGFNNPGGLAFDPTDGSLYIGTGDRVYHYTTTGTQLGSFNTPDLALGRIRFVDGLEFQGASAGPTIPRSVRFPEKIWALLERRAKARGLTLHAALREAILEWARGLRTSRT